MDAASYRRDDVAEGGRRRDVISDLLLKCQNIMAATKQQGY
jgi:hypothetical protein